MADYVRKQLSFDTQSEEEMKMLQVLDKFKKNQTNVVVFALAEFAEKYNLYGKTPAELEQFIKTYPYIKSYLGGMMLTPRMAPVEMTPAETEHSVASVQVENLQKGKPQKELVPKEPEVQSNITKKPEPVQKKESSASNDIQVSEAAKASMNNILSMFSNSPV